jgi:hypothetical protein
MYIMYVFAPCTCYTDNTIEVRPQVYVASDAALGLLLQVLYCNED